MIKDILNNLIMTSMKAHNQVRTETYRAIKTAIMNWETAKENTGKVLTEADEIIILKKMVKQREESMNQYFEAGREDLANAEADQITIIKEFLPAEVTKEQIVEALVNICNTEHIACDKRNMGVLIKRVKEKLIGADGKLVADIVKSNLS